MIKNVDIWVETPPKMTVRGLPDGALTTVWVEWPGGEKAPSQDVRFAFHREPGRIARMRQFAEDLSRSAAELEVAADQLEAAGDE